ncbi:MAG TPA: M18 family aminopeptidase, partial [Gammaproteobacteria bacterium]|nr:M18 family aminopeptidase [Gammaproteobacteria bacterium]
MNADTFNPGLLEYLHRSPTPFHAVASMLKQLQARDFTALDEGASWPVSHKDAGFITRNDSSLCAFRIGNAPISETGLRIIGTHTDSPCLKIKPQPEFCRQGILQLGVEVYGGALLAPWFDRDLSLAGRVTCKTHEGKSISVLIDFEKPIATIPSLAIHLNRDIHKNRSINPQKELVPLLCDLAGETEPDFRQMLADQARQQHPDAKIEAVIDFEISCYDTQPGQQVGLNGD